MPSGLFNVPYRLNNKCNRTSVRMVAKITEDFSRYYEGNKIIFKEVAKGKFPEVLDY